MVFGEELPIILANLVILPAVLVLGLPYHALLVINLTFWKGLAVVLLVALVNGVALLIELAKFVLHLVLLALVAPYHALVVIVTLFWMDHHVF